MLEVGRWGTDTGDMTTTETRRQRPMSNRYAADCVVCGKSVPAGDGILAGKVNRRWAVRHTACPMTPAMPTNRPPTATRHAYYGMTWPVVLEANEHFDGEPEITDAARTAWGRVSGMFCRRHGDAPSTPGTCWECDAEHEEAIRDRNDGWPPRGCTVSPGVLAW